jgi:hypothetical protein
MNQSNLEKNKNEKISKFFLNNKFVIKIIIIANLISKKMSLDQSSSFTYF